MSKTIRFKKFKEWDEQTLLLIYTPAIEVLRIQAKLGIDWSEDGKLNKYTNADLPDELSRIRPGTQDDFSITIKRVFHFKQEDLMADLSETETLAFKFAHVTTVGESEYYLIPKNILDINQDVLLCAEREPKWEYFGAGYEKRTSVFVKISALTSEGETQIIIGGTADNAIPWDDFDQLLEKFPTTALLQHYGETVMARFISEYLTPRKDYEQQYANSRRRRAVKTGALEESRLGTPRINENLHKSLVESRDILADSLQDKDSHNEDF
jgi:hypothetical protein